MVSPSEHVQIVASPHPAIGENPYPFSLGLGRWLENA